MAWFDQQFVLNFIVIQLQLSDSPMQYVYVLVPAAR